MNLEINEEERAFLERVCHRIERLAWLAADEMDLKKIIVLKDKLAALDANRITKIIDGNEECKLPDPIGTVKYKCPIGEMTSNVQDYEP